MYICRVGHFYFTGHFRSWDSKDNISHMTLTLTLCVHGRCGVLLHKLDLRLGRDTNTAEQLTNVHDSHASGLVQERAKIP